MNRREVIQIKYFYSYDTSIGEICLAEEDGEITELVFLNPEAGCKRNVCEKAARMVIGSLNEQKETPLLKEAASQLREYLEGCRQSFKLPLKPKGTDFQLKVWKALESIPYGQTRSYKDIAAMCGNEKACRAVGMANNRNPISIFIPCHRVIGRDGRLVGYGGGLCVKERLLRLEQEALAGKEAQPEQEALAGKEARPDQEALTGKEARPEPEAGTGKQETGLC